MLSDVDHGLHVDGDDFEARVPDLRMRLLEAQAEMRERRIPALVVLAGDDRWGCSEVLDRLHQWLDPARLDTVVRLPATEAEDERPFLWSSWRDLPRRGRIGVTYGGWPHRLVLERMRDRIDEPELDRRLEAVRSMDRMLADDGMIIARVWVHAPRDEHRRRFEAGRSHPEWKWRLDATDRAILERYEEVVPLAERCVAATDAAHAPWRIVSSMDVRARDLAVGEFLLERLEHGLRDATRTVAGSAGTQAEPGPGASPPAASASAPPGAAPSAGRLAELDLSAHLPKDAYAERKAVLQARLARRMRQLADAGQSAVVVMEGPDAAGKGGAIRRVVAALPATMERVVRIGAPTDEEADRHYLWRFWRPLPPAGHLLIFDRSWYGRVLVERVEGYAREDEWRRAYDEIVAFESQLLGHGMAVVKLWLHIDRDEQARRFEAREATGWKRHKISEADWRARERWDDYVAAAEEMFARTSTKAAPWTIVPANDKRYARVQVLETITKTLKRSLWKDRRRRR